MVSLLAYGMYEKRPIRDECESGVCIGTACDVTGERLLKIARRCDLVLAGGGGVH